MEAPEEAVEAGGEFESLRSNRIHLWITPYRDPRLDGALPRYRAMLDSRERAREEGYVLPEDRRRFLAARALLRTTLSRYVRVPAPQWRFEADAHGKPRVALADTLARGLQFNLSHTAGLIVLAVALERETGVDVEYARRGAPVLELARRCLTPSEAADVGSMPRGEQARRFFEYWTLKEAYLKARGQGLSIAPDRFGFAWSAGGPITMLTQTGWDDSGANWQFWQWLSDTGHLVALCARRDAARAVPQIECRRAWPLLAQERATVELLHSPA